MPGGSVAAELKFWAAVRTGQLVGAAVFKDENGSGVVGEPVLAAGVMAPVAAPLEAIAPALRVAPLETETVESDCTRQVDSIWDVPPSARLSPPEGAVTSTQSGVRAALTAVAFAVTLKPPAGSILAKKEGTVESISTWIV